MLRRSSLSRLPPPAASRVCHVTTVRFRTVDANAYAPLSDFSCGGNADWEREVDGIVHNLYRSSTSGVTVRVAEDPSSGGFMGVCCIEGRPLFLAPGMQAIIDAAFVHVIALPGSSRGQHLDDGCRIGVAVLLDALTTTCSMWGGSMPPVWASVHVENRACHRLLTEARFNRLPGQPGDEYALRVRPRKLHPENWLEAERRG